MTKTTTPGSTPNGAIGQAFETLSVETRGPGLSDQTAAVRAWLDRIGAGDGLLTLFIRHTSASLLIQENADPDVHTDLLDALERLAPRDRAYVHDVEGPGRHAGAHQVGADGDVAVDPGAGGPDAARHLAGHLRRRAPRPAAPARGRAALHRHARGG